MKKGLVALVLATFLILIVWCMFATPDVSGTMITPRLIEFLRWAPTVNPDAFSIRLRIAVAATSPGRDKEANVKQIESISRKAKLQYQDLRLILFGESSLGLYYDNQDPMGYQRRIAEPVPGPTSVRLAGLAEDLHIYIAYGAIESDGDKLYNSLIVLDPLGHIIAKHRKMLLHYLDEASGITLAQPNSQTFDIDGVKFGLAICADANSRWLHEEYVRQHIDALLYSVTSKVPFISEWLRYWPYSSKYNSWIIAANRYGNEGKESYPGTVFVSAPNGHIQEIDSLREGYLGAVIGK